MIYKRLLTLPLSGRSITLRGIVYGKGFKRKKECILFSLKTFSHKTVSNLMPLSIPPCTLWAQAILSRVEGERARGDHIAFLFTSKMLQQRRQDFV